MILPLLCFSMGMTCSGWCTALVSFCSFFFQQEKKRTHSATLPLKPDFLTGSPIWSVILCSSSRVTVGFLAASLINVLFLLSQFSWVAVTDRQFLKATDCSGVYLGVSEWRELNTNVRHSFQILILNHFESFSVHFTITFYLCWFIA